MMRALLVVGLSLAALLVPFAAQAEAAQPLPSKAKQTAKPVWTLALDGPRVAYASGGRVYVWNVATGATSVIRGRYSNATHSVDAASIAISGKRVSWTKRQQFGNHEMSERLYTAPVGGRAHLVGSAYIGNGHTGWIGGVVGSTKLLAVSTWNSDGTSVAHRRLNLVTPTGPRPIATGTGTIVAASAGGSHIAVFRSTIAWPSGPEGSYPSSEAAPTVGIYSTRGTLLGQVGFDAGSEIALSGDRLVVLARTKIDVYDWTTGGLVHSWPVAANPGRAAGNLAVYGRLAVYSVDPYLAAPRRLHLLDLTTGKDVVLAHAFGGYQHDAALGARGLVYVVNHPYPAAHAHGRLVLVPMAKLLEIVR